MQLARGVWKLAVWPFLAAVGLLAISGPWAVVAALLGVGVLWFHRDPERNPPDHGVLSPADGTVSVLRREGDRVRVGVFMNVTDVHVNRSPVAGTVRSVEHVPGAHRPAFTKDSDRNERVHVAFDDLEVTLIAGWFARRIHPYVEEGDVLGRGEKIGHVSFGSRADVLLPPGVAIEDVRVEKGDTVRAGETVMAD